MDEHLDKLMSAGITLTGNTAKVRVLVELSRLIEATPGLSILDIGCIGPNPLDFWKPLLWLYQDRFNLTGIDPDAAGIERTRPLFPDVTLIPGTGYDLTTLFPTQKFDIIVFTQVLEHVYRYGEFLQQVAQVCRPSGQVMFSLDSGHYPRPEWFKGTVKGILARLGNESHYEHGWRDHEVESALGKFKILERGYYCLPANKKIHNRYLPEAQKNEFLRLWYTQEVYANHKIQFDDTMKRQYLGLFYHVQALSETL
jgi:SAM-dependent methyltransferase